MNSSDKDPLSRDITKKLKKERKKEPLKKQKNSINLKFWLSLIIVVVMLLGIVFSLINILR